MKNDLEELSAFAMVAEERSFTRAAARLATLNKDYSSVFPKITVEAT